MAVPRTSIYQAPTLVICAKMSNGNRLENSSIDYRIYNDKHLDSQARNLAGDWCALCVCVGVSEDAPARLKENLRFLKSDDNLRF